MGSIATKMYVLMSATDDVFNTCGWLWMSPAAKKEVELMQQSTECRTES